MKYNVKKKAIMLGINILKRVKYNVVSIIKDK